MKTRGVNSELGGRVEEFLGVEGEFGFSEILLQKVWARRDFSEERARLEDGRELRVLRVGKWNRMGGPDFFGAKLLVDGVELSGDVEVHLHERDWGAHGHAGDRAYDGVVLHVVLFGCGRKWTEGAGGRRIPVLVMLPLLRRGLEELAEDEAVEVLAGRNFVAAGERLAELGEEGAWGVIREMAARRWRRKVHFAGERVERLGWEGACHETALEVLGYAQNREAMRAVAGRFGLEDWKRGVDVEEVLEWGGERWCLRGVRPANHPRARLEQYARWVEELPKWTEELERLGEELPVLEMEGETGAVRKGCGLRKWEERVAGICGGELGGARLGNLVCDGFLPLLGAVSGRGLEGIWWHWWAGDLPAGVKRVFGMLHGKRRVFCQGAGQGILGWMLREK